MNMPHILTCNITLPERTCNYTWYHLRMLRLGKTIQYLPFWWSGLISKN